MVTGQCRAVFFPCGSAQVHLSQMSQPASESATTVPAVLKVSLPGKSTDPGQNPAHRRQGAEVGRMAVSSMPSSLRPCMPPPSRAASPYGSTDLDPSYLDGGFVGNQLPLEALLLLQQVLNPLKVPPVVLGAHT